MRRLLITLSLSLAGLLGVVTAGAQAIVLSDAGSVYGVTLVPGSRASLASAGITPNTSSGPCTDPALSSDLVLPSDGLCSHSGPVLHGNETFSVAWDPDRRYWEGTRNYVEQFLRSVADGSGGLTSPYAVTGQYTDSGGHAAYTSLFGGGCIDYGSAGGYACRFGQTDGSGPGHDYRASGCPVTGLNQYEESLSGAFGSGPNDICLTDAQLSQEVSAMVTEAGLLSRAKPGYMPVVTLLTPPGVVLCLDAPGHLCSANSTAPARFCSYHSQVDVGGIKVPYVVQPWTASWTTQLGCDEPDATSIPANPSPQQLATDVGQRLVSPLSQAHIATVVNPALNGWFALDGSEINDNGCVPLGNGLDTVPVAGASYLLQREFNNAGVIETDPNALSCTPDVLLAPAFVVPSSINRGDVAQFDGSTTASTLIVPRTSYIWSFGDGTGAVGPSVEHTYANGGSYTVRLTVTDRGDNQANVTQTLVVLGAGSQTPAPPGALTTPGFRARLQLLPQGLGMMLRNGLRFRVSSNEPADGIATLSMSRGAARRAHIRGGDGAPSVVIGRGTISGVRAGTLSLTMRVSRGLAARLVRLRHVTLTVRLLLLSAGRAHIILDAAGHY
ncbi:MAG: PKD domain-containing protein [Solirubrobacteraceae bacterium]